MTPFQQHLLPKTASGLAVLAASIYLLPNAVPFLSWSGTEWRSLGVFAAFWAIAAIGLDITWGVAGHTQLGQQGFIAVGAYTVAIATTKWDWPTGLSIVFSVLVGVVIALVIGRIVLRLEQVYLALATLAFGFMVPFLATGLDSLGKATGLFGIPSIDFLIFDFTRRQWYWVGWVIVGVAAIIAIRFARSMTGLGWRFIAENQQVAEALGVATRTEKEKAFMVSAAFASVAGALYATLNSAIGPDAFKTQVLLILVFAVVAGGRGTILGPVFGTIVTFIALIYAGRQGGKADLIMGAAFVLTLYFLPRGLAGFASRVIRLGAAAFSSSPAVPDRAEVTEVAEVTDVAEVTVDLDENEMLSKFGSWRADRHRPEAEWSIIPGSDQGRNVVKFEAATKHFGGIEALTDVSITFEPGIVHGIVGPNGAGKSTLLAVASGVYIADSGSVVCFGDDVTQWPAWKRARRGMARTFQAPQLVSNLTVLENVAGGVYSTLGAGLARALTPLEGRALQQARGYAEEALETIGIPHLAEAAPQDLSFGQQRLVELARALVRAPAVLWLDEPASGLDMHEKELLSTIVRAYARTGAVVGFIEHDTELVAKTCDVATVLDTGRVVHEGPADKVFEVDLVRELYMGAEDDPSFEEVTDK